MTFRKYSNTNKGLKEFADTIIGLATSRKPGMVKFEIPMFYFPSQNTIAYLDKITGECVYFHENGSLWSANRSSSLGVSKLLNDPNMIQNPS